MNCQRIVLGADFNGHVGEGNHGYEKVLGRYGFRRRNKKGQKVADFAKSMELARRMSIRLHAEVEVGTHKLAM